jgi:hypothetical protein
MTGITANSATANWTLSPGETGYSVRYRIVGAATWSGPITATSTATSVPLPTTLSSGTFYEVQVSASNANGASDYSSSVIFKTLGTGVSAPILSNIIQPSCTGSVTGSVTLGGLPATGTWSIDQFDGATHKPYSSTGATYTVTGLAMGAYTYTVTQGSSTSAPSASLTINQGDTIGAVHSALTVTQPSCTGAPTGSFTLRDFPQGQWTLNPGNIVGSGNWYQVTGVQPGKYLYTVSQGHCTSHVSDTITVNALPATPSAPNVSVTQPTCTSIGGTVTLSGLPITPPGKQYTITRSDGQTVMQPNSTGSNSTYAWTKHDQGTYTYKVDILGCQSAASGAATVSQGGAAPSPTVGTITQPTCSSATGSIPLSGLQSGDAIAMTNYVFSATATGSTYTITNQSQGAHFIYITRGGCSSAPVTAVINPQPAAPPTSALIVGMVIQPTCQVLTGSVALSGLPFSYGETWTVNRNPGGASITGTGGSVNFSGVPTGTYTFTYTVNGSSCVSPASTAATVNGAASAPGVPSPGTPSGNSVVVSGLPSSGTWALYKTLTSVTPNVTTEVATGTGTSYTVTGLDPGTYTFKVANNNFCISNSSTPVTIAASGLTLNLTAAIQGYLNTTTNRMNMTDKIKVILRANVAPGYTLLDSATVNLDSATLSATMAFHPATTAANYYIVVKHRNSVETWSNPVTFTGGSLSYNFTDAATEAYGNNLIQKGTKFCIYGADVNQDRTIDLKDASPIQNAINNYLAGYLLPTDVTGDHQVDLKDSSVEFNNQSNYVHAQCPICN